MKTSVKIALLLGGVTFAAGAGLGFAQMSGPRPPDGPMQGLVSSPQSRTGNWLVRFDSDHDGKITQAEMNNVIGTRFAAAAQKAPRMTLEQYLAARADDFLQHNAKVFKSIDWNGDGKLSLSEYTAPQRVRFATMDRGGKGTVSCAPGRGTATRGALKGFCADNDFNLDGTVTRAELDKAAAKRFAQATGGGNAMTVNQFAVSEQERFRDVNERAFRRLDKNKDGVLTVQEYGGNELRLFARRDKNKDRVLTRDELPKSTRGSRSSKKRK